MGYKFNPFTGKLDDVGNPAPVDATYIVQTPNATLTNEQALSALATGLLKNANGTGILTTAVQGTDYYAPGGAEVAVADGGTGASTASGARTNLGLVIGTDVQAFDATLLSIAALGTTADRVAYTTGVDTWAETPLTSFGRSLIDDSSASVARVTLGLEVGQVDVVIGDGSSTILTGIHEDIYFTFPFTITEVTLLAKESGSIVIDLWKDTYANFPPTVADTITASAKPTLSSAQKSQDSTLTGWTTSVSAGNTIRINVDSCTTITQVTMTIKFTR